MPRRLAHALWLTVLLIGCSSTTPEPVTEVAVEGSAATESEALLPLDPALTIGRLDNGLRYYIRLNTKPENRAELWLAVNAGSMQEDDDQLGLAHLVEHMAFNGTHHFAKQELIDYLERIGMRFGPDINAYTSFDETVYMLRVPTDDAETLQQAFQILEDWSQGVSFDDEEIDKERGVVIEEWRLGRGAEARIRDLHFPVLFRDSRYAERLTIGDPEILENAPYNAIRRFYRDWYRPDLMAVIAIGDFDPEVIESQIHTHFEGLSAPENLRPRVLYPVPDHDETLYSIATDPEMTLTSVGVYYKLEKRSQGTKQAYRRQLVEELYHGMINARLDELRQKPDPPFLFAVSTAAGFVRTRDVYLQHAGVQEGKLATGMEALLTEIERVDRHGFTASELERMKADLLRLFEQAFEERDKRDSGSFASEYLRHYLEGEPSPGIEVELKMVREMLPGISLDELNHLAEQWITDSNRVVLVSGPEKEEVTLPAEAELAAVFARVEGREIESFVDQVRDAPLLSERPTPAEIVERQEIPELEVTEWKLANGIRVILKPTDFKNDQILLTAYSPGGHSLVPDSEFQSATFADTVVGEGGLGDFNQIELEKALAGKVARAHAFIGELEEGLQASASPQDLETMLQLLYLAVTAPRKDPDAFAAFMTRMKAFLENRKARPGANFGDDITLALYQGHLRRLPPSLEMLDKIELDAAFRIYHDRFADTSDFTFIIVGNFEPESIEPLVETYLGGMPTTGRSESWRDIGVEKPDGIVRVVTKKGLEPKSRVRVIFGGPSEWSRERLHDIVTLSEGLRIRLREVLREDMGATYGVGVSGSLRHRPKDRYRFSIEFGCAPENVDEMLDTLFQELHEVRADGLDDNTLTKVKEIQRRRRETDLKENGFWLSVLKSYYTHEWDPRLILDYEPLVERATRKQVRESADRFLDPDNHLLGILYPENWQTPATENEAVAAESSPRG